MKILFYLLVVLVLQVLSKLKNTQQFVESKISLNDFQVLNANADSSGPPDGSPQQWRILEGSESTGSQSDEPSIDDLPPLPSPSDLPPIDQLPLDDLAELGNIPNLDELLRDIPFDNLPSLDGIELPPLDDLPSLDDIPDINNLPAIEDIPSIDDIPQPPAIDEIPAEPWAWGLFAVFIKVTKN